MMSFIMMSEGQVIMWGGSQWQTHAHAYAQNEGAEEDRQQWWEGEDPFISRHSTPQTPLNQAALPYHALDDKPHRISGMGMHNPSNTIRSGI